MSDYSVSATFTLIDDMSSVFATIGQAAADNITNIVSQSEGLTSTFDALGLSTEVVGGAFGLLADVVAIGVQQFLDVDSAMAQVAATSGLWGADLEMVKESAKALFDSGLVSNFNDAAAAAEAVYKKVRGLADQQAYNDFAVLVGGVAKAWGVTAASVAQSINLLQGDFTDLATNPKQALDILNQTAAQSGLTMSQTQAIIAKTGEKFAGAGLSAFGMGGMIVTAAQAGISPAGMGGLATAVDTFHTRLTNPPKGFNAALKKLGMGSVASDLANNKTTMDAALDKIFDKISKLPTPAAQTAEKIALFGNAAANIPLEKLIHFSTALGGPDGVAGSADAAGKALSGSLDGGINQVTNSLKDSLGEQVQLFLTNAMNGAMAAGLFLNTFWDFINIGLHQLGNLVTQWLNDTADSIGTGISTTLNSFSDSVTNWIQGISDGATAIFEGFWNLFDGIITGLQQDWDSVWNAILASVSAINKLITDAGGAFTDAGAVIDAALKPVNDFIQGIIDKINEAVGALNKLLGMGGGAGGTGGVTGFGSAFPGTAPQPHAEGGILTQGWNVVGEKGPELIHGATGRVYPNGVIPSEFGGSSSGSNSSVKPAPDNSGNKQITIRFDTGSGTIVDMSAFMQQVYVAMQSEDVRRGLR